MDNDIKWGEYGLKKLISNIRSRWLSCRLCAADVFAALCSGFILASIVFIFSGDFQNLNYTDDYPLALSLFFFLFGSFAIITAALAFRTKKVIVFSLMCLSLFLACALVIFAGEGTGGVYFAVGVGAVLLLVSKYASDNDWAGFAGEKLTYKHNIMIIWVLVAVFTLAVTYFTALKYFSFSTATFDFGIFAQMFENMCKTGLPVTSVERGRELSHFAVHFSPFFYVLLPGYFIFRTPVFLLFAQAFGVALGAFAVHRICKSLYLSPKCSLAAAVIYLVFPTMANGCFYDFHENKFLAVLILWTVAFAIEKKPVGFCIFAFLTLCVKEDAFIYILAICIWMIITARMRKVAIPAAVFSVCWFFFACSMMLLLGGEIMDSRFVNFSRADNATLLDAAKTCFVNIGYLIHEVFSGADTEAYREITYTGQKMEFVLWTMFPLCFAPLLRRRPSELVLLLPMLAINLMPDWMYQYNVDFQYTYGSAALIIVLFLLFLREREGWAKGFVITASLMMCIVFSCALIHPKASYHTDKYYKDRDMYIATEEALDTVDEDSSVTVYGYMMPHLAYIEDLHACPEYYKEYQKTDYYVIDKRYEKDTHTQKMYGAMGDDYELILEKGYAKIYKLKEAD